MPPITVEKIMSPDLYYLETPGTRAELLEAIKKYDWSYFPVVKKGTTEVVGIIGRRHIMKNPTETQLSLLLEPTLTVKKNESVLTLAKKVVESNHSKLPIVDSKNQLKGVVSIDDIIRKVIYKKEINKEIQNYMEKGVTIIWEETPVNVAARILVISGQESLPVISVTGELSGIISLHDFIKSADVLHTSSKSSMAAGGDSEVASWDSESILIIENKILSFPQKPVSTMMTKTVITTYPEDFLSDAAKKFRKHDIDQMPVISVEGDIIGMVTNRNLLQAYLEHEINRKS
ncbi:MAG: CBS domain-containing protein [Candidatus Hodarchaeales archaeon]|jgi:CBS domain-containing protein